MASLLITQSSPLTLNEVRVTGHLFLFKGWAAATCCTWYSCYVSAYQSEAEKEIAKAERQIAKTP